MFFRILWLALGTFVIGTDGFMISGLLSRIATDLHISIETAGQMVTSFAIAYAVGSPLLATLTGNVPRKRLLITSLLVFSLANGLAAFSHTYTTLLIARILAALAAALYTPAATAVAAALASPEKRGRALATVLGGLTVATAIGVPFGTWIGNQQNWHTPFLLVGITGLVATCFLLMLLPVTGNPPALTLRQRFAPLQNKRVLLALSTTTLWTIGGFSVFTYITPLLQGMFAINSVQLTSLILIYGVSSIFGNMIGGYGADHWGAKQTLGGSLLLLTCTFVSFSLMSTWHTSTLLFPIIAMIVWGVTGWTLQAPQQHRLLALAPASPNVVLSLNSSALYVGVALGALIGGMVIKWVGTSALGWTGALFEVAALTLMLLSVRQSQQGTVATVHLRG